MDHRLIREVQERLGSFSKKAPNVLASSINRTVTNISSNVTKEVRKDYNVKAGEIKATLSKTKASRSSLSGIVKSRGELIPLDRFKVSPRSVQPKRKKPIKIAVKKGSMKDAIGAFVAEINGTKVFKRETKKRLPIKRLFGPSIPQMIGNQTRIENINREGYEMFNRRLDHEINRILSRGSSS